MKSILISGGNGLIGKTLSRKLVEKGYRVSILSRSQQNIPGIKSYTWNWEKQEIEKGAVENADIIIHLAGENVGAGRWTKRRKQQIIDSRIKTTSLLFNTVQKTGTKLEAFISSSATGYYGSYTSEKVFKEDDMAANDFLGYVCQVWEDAADQFQSEGIRTAKIRTGVVLTNDGGALPKMTKPIVWGIGSALGSGRQYIPWIHLDDLCKIYIKATEDQNMIGAYNAVASSHITNKELTEKIAGVLKKPLWLPNVPAFVIKAMFGEMSQIVLKGNRISNEKILKTGLQFQFTDIVSALNNIYKTKNDDPTSI